MGENLSLPQTEISAILGLVELLNAKGGKEDIYKLAHELQMELGDTLTVIRAAELLGLVHTPGGDVVLEPLGKKITRSQIRERKVLMKAQILKIPVFMQATEHLKALDGQKTSRSEILEKLVEWIPGENVETTFLSLVRWGRYAELFGYDDDAEVFFLDPEPAQVPKPSRKRSK